jgi:sporulation protein YlmC with PRC-barrel domain
MLITHVKPAELWGKKVYDTRGRFLGEVVAIASRRGVVRKVLVQRAGHGLPVRLLPPSDANVDSETLVVPLPTAAMPARLHVVR